MKKLKLSPEYALSFEWSKAAYDKNLTDSFLQYFDLSESAKLLNECRTVCQWYHEVHINEIFFERKCIGKQFSCDNKPRLVINLGAGKSLMSLQLLEDYNDNIDRIIEIDTDVMDKREELYNIYYPHQSKKIKCVTANFTCAPILTFISSLVRDFFASTPCLILMNDSSHYLNEAELNNILACFKSKDKTNTIVIDYLLPPINMDYNNHIPSRIFNIVKKDIVPGRVMYYSHEAFSHLFKSAGCELVSEMSMTQIEKERMGLNKYFMGKENDWAHCTVWKL